MEASDDRKYSRKMCTNALSECEVLAARQKETKEESTEIPLSF